MLAKAQWRDSMRPRIEDARESLRHHNLEDLVRGSGATYGGDHLALNLFTTPLRIALPEFEIQSAKGVACREETQILILDYLIRAKSERSSDRTQPSNQWIGFQELPDGAFYASAFRSYTSDALLKTLDEDIDRFRHAAECIDGEPFSLGDAAFKFRALPNISLAIVWWAGDSEFPATANALFDAAAAHALPIDGMAALGRLLCRGLVSAEPVADV